MIRGADLDLRIRPATEADLPACERIWGDALNAYGQPLGSLPIPLENPAIRRLHRHALSTDPDRFLVAVREGRGSSTASVDEPVAFGSALIRDDVWFLSMLFVEPAVQARGIGRTLLDELLAAGGTGAPGTLRPPGATPGPSILATATDAAQPISNGLYASVGIVPRMPLLNLVGRPRSSAALPPLPPGISAQRVGVGAPGSEDAALAAEIGALDRRTIGFAHPADHAFVRAEGRYLFTFRDARGSLRGYGYTSEVGRIAPIVVADPDLLAPVAAYLLTVVEPRGASALWVPGDAGEMLGMLVRAGLRIEGFPVLMAWSRPFADFSRCTPISPGLL